MTAALADRVATFAGLKRTAQFRRDDECIGCLEIRRLLMPVAFDICYGDEPTTMYLCLACRLNCCDARDFDYMMPRFYALVFRVLAPETPRQQT